MDLLFDDEQEKSIYRQRWDAVKEHSSFEQLKATVPTFRRGIYSMREQTAGIYGETKAEDRLNFVQMVKTMLAKVANRNNQDRMER